jgi:CheY-like chemotaxis protein
MATILLLDDDPDDLTLTSMLLSDQGYLTLRACETQGALAMAVRSPPHLVVIDCTRFDVSTSIALCLALRAEPRTREIPIVLLADLPQAPLGRGQAYDVFLRAPEDLERLIECIDVLIARGAQCIAAGAVQSSTSP